MKFLSDITLGTYYPGTSSIHSLDPRVKLAGLLVSAVTLLTLQNLWGLVLFALASLWLVQMARLPLRLVIGGLRPFAGLLVLTACLQILFTGGHKLIPVALGPLSLSREGFSQALRICGQICLIILLSSVLTLSTSPLELLRGLEKLAMPLKRFRVPVAELCLAMLLCIRFLPILGQESQRIMEAQRARGIDPASGTWRQRLQKFHGIFLPLLYNVFWRAEELATAMAVRGYGRSREKQTLKHMRLSPADRLSLALVAAWCLTLHYLFHG
jgi:energy-coupling factor transport system permease protein